MGNRERLLGHYRKSDRASGLSASGACRDRIPVYANLGEIRSNEQRKEDAGRLVEEGFKAVKIRFTHETIREDIAIVEAVRGSRRG